MPSRRQEKVARVVNQAVSEAINNHLSDPRIEGFISVTRVEMAANLRNAEVYISIFGTKNAGQSKTFAAITHAKSKIQSFVAGKMTSKFCPVLHFHIDEKFKKVIDILNLIEKAASEIKEKDSVDQQPK